MDLIFRSLRDYRACANDVISESGEDTTDGVSSCGGEVHESRGEEDTEDDGSRRPRLRRAPSRMKVCFDVSQASVRLRNSTRRRSSLSHLLRRLSGGSEGSAAGLEKLEEEKPDFLSERTFWRGVGAPPRLAEIAFDGGTTQYCVVSHQADPRRLCHRVMLQEWGLANPKLILSIMGGAGNIGSSLDRDKFDIDKFSKGLVEAALRTGAWVITGGTKSGVMEIVGQAMKEHDRQRLVPCIGISPLGGLKARWREALLEGCKAEPKVDAPKANEYVEDNSDRFLAEIQENHTHAILCDNGQVGKEAFGKEVSLRADLEAYLGSRYEQSLARSSSKRGNIGVSTSPGAQVPRVMILVNGGKISLQFVQEFIEHRCPVVVCRGTGRVADLIGRLMEVRQEMMDQEWYSFTDHFDEEFDLAAEEHMRSEMQSLTQEDRERTLKIVESGWVEVYTISKRLEGVVMQAVLGNTTTRTQNAVSVRQQLMLAVQWGCTDYFDMLGRKLVQDCGGEKDGPAKAIEMILKELMGVWASSSRAKQQSEVPESSGALVAWLLNNYRKHMDQFRIPEASMGKVEWHRLGGPPLGSLESLLLWCIEQNAPASVLETIWMYMEDAAHAGLVAASACRDRGARRFGSASYGDTVARANLESIADRFERLSCLLLEDLAANGKGVEYLFQESDRYHKITCFRLAHDLSCKKFVSTTFYRLAVDLYWRTPTPFSIRKGQLGAEYLRLWNLLWLLFHPEELKFTFGDFLSIPYIKCCTHGISRCSFIALYSYAVFYGLTYRRGFSLARILLLLWGLGFGMVEIRQLTQKGSFGAYILDFWNVLDALVISTLLITLTVGSCLPEGYESWGRTLEVIHSLNLLPTWIRVGQVLQLDQELGTLFLTMGGICKDALRFLVLVSIVCLGFSCALTPMLFKDDERDTQGLLWAFWTIVGSIDEQALTKIHGPPLERPALEAGLPSPPEESLKGGYLAHILFYTLMLVSNVLLVNLLIAVMNSTYERNMENSQTEWAFYKVQTVLEFDEWADLPPPLNLLELFWRRRQDEERSSTEHRRPTRRGELSTTKRDLKDSQQKALVAVGLEEDAGESAILRTENAELRRRNAELLRRKEELEGLAANYLMEERNMGATRSNRFLAVGTSSGGTPHPLANAHNVLELLRYNSKTPASPTMPPLPQLPSLPTHDSHSKPTLPSPPQSTVPPETEPSAPPSPAAAAPSRRQGLASSSSCSWLECCLHRTE